MGFGEVRCGVGGRAPWLLTPPLPLLREVSDAGHDDIWGENAGAGHSIVPDLDGIPHGHDATFWSLGFLTRSLLLERVLQKAGRHKRRD